MSPGADIIVHGSCVAFAARAVLILGASGSGKSALALELMARGGLLVADDRTRIAPRDGVLVASAPDAIRGMIEARGVGLLAADTCAAAVVVLAVDMDRIETERLPPVREILLAGQTVALLHKVERSYFPAAIVQYIKAGRRA